MLLTTDEVTKATKSLAGSATEFLHSLRDNFGATAIQVLMKVAVALLIFFVGRLLIKWIRNISKRNFHRANVDVGVQQFADSLINVCMYAVLMFIIISNFGINTTSIAAILASATVAISLALQGTLSNFAGGVLILVTKPFSVGDYIIEDNNQNEGTVKEIKLFYTKLTTIENKTVVIPNSMLTSNSLTNVTAREERQLDLKIHISYDSDLKKAKDILTELLHEEEGVLEQERVQVFVDELGASAVVIGIRAWIKTEEYWKVRWRLLENIKLTLESNQIEVPFNQLTVHMKENQ